MSFDYTQKDGPILVSFPHDGDEIPPTMARQMTDAGRSSMDTDWYISTVYDFIKKSNISFVKAKYSRYVIDLNRPPDGTALYPGHSETGLCPVETFDGQPLYLGHAPSAKEIEQRIENYWAPYHQHLVSELKRIVDKHGYAILWDAHSIRGVVPRFFSGKLPDLNFGTAEGKTCDEKIIRRVMAKAEQSDYTVVLNGRFKGGYITRHYGQPGKEVSAIQLEINQDTYLETPWPPVISEAKVRRLKRMIEACLRAALE